MWTTPVTSRTSFFDSVVGENSTIGVAAEESFPNRVVRLLRSIGDSEEDVD
jgi:hypothetical protein